MKFIYYNILENWHCGELAIASHLPDANDLSSAELDFLGWVKAAIPDDWDSVHCQYKDEQLITRPDAPPYWDDLGKGLISNPLFQRISPLRLGSLPINGVMSQIEAVIGIGKDQTSLAYLVAGLRSLLASIGQPVTTEEIAATEALLTGCGFQANFFTYSQNVVNPPPPPTVP